MRFLKKWNSVLQNTCGVHESRKIYKKNYDVKQFLTFSFGVDRTSLEQLLYFFDVR
jgi:hypothetical protein